MRVQETGFTLIELVVVIVLIGILAGVALPRVFQSVSSAYDAQAQATAATMQSTLSGLVGDILLGETGAAKLGGAIFRFTSSGLPYMSAAPATGGSGSGVNCKVLLSPLGGVSAVNIYATIYTLSVTGGTLNAALGTVGTTNFTALTGVAAASPGNFLVAWGAPKNITTSPLGLAMGVSANACVYIVNQASPSSLTGFYYSDAATPAVGTFTISGGGPIL